MATRKDLLKAQSFVHQRLVRALVDRAPDGVTSPLRRVVMGTFAGVMVGVLIVAVFGIIGWIHPGSTDKWKVDKTVVVDSTSGGVFVYLEGKLYQTYNITSAKLATGGGKVVSVKSQSLKGFPREGWIGIKDAPRQLPALEDMKGFPIRLCSSAPTGDRRDTTLEIGEPVPTPAVNPAVAVRDDSGEEYLILNGVAHRAPKAARDSRSPLLVDLGFTTVAAPGNAFLLGLPQGSPLTAPKIPGLGTASSHPVGGHATIGTVFQVQGQVGSWYVLLNDGLAPIDAIQARALVVGKHLPQARIDPGTAAQSASRPRVGATDLPDALPDPGQAPQSLASSSLCATWTADEKPPRLSFGADTPTVHQESADPNVADAIIMPPVTGALMQPNTTTGPDAAVALVTDSRRYGIADGQARDALGYHDAKVVRVAPQLLNLIPQGLPAGQQLSIPGASPGGRQ